MRSFRLFALASGVALAFSTAFAGPAAAQVSGQAAAACLQPGQSMAGLTEQGGLLQTSDGVTFYDTSEATRALFVQVWGECAPVQWAIQHELELAALGASPIVVSPAPIVVSPGAMPQDFDPPASVALDGQTLADQPLATQQRFIETWGTSAAEVWVAQHNDELIAAGLVVIVPEDELNGE